MQRASWSYGRGTPFDRPTRATRRGILVPALIDNISIETIPWWFRRIQAANLVGWSGALPHTGFADLAHAVEGILGARSAQRPVPSEAAPAAGTDVPRTPSCLRASHACSFPTGSSWVVAGGSTEIVSRVAGPSAAASYSDDAETVTVCVTLAPSVKETRQVLDKPLA